MRRFLQKTLGIALMGILLATPFMYAQGRKGGKGGGRGGAGKKSGSRKKGGGR